MLKVYSAADYLATQWEKDQANYVPKEEIIMRELHKALTEEVTLSKETIFFLYHWVIEGDVFNEFQEIWRDLLLPGCKINVTTLYRGAESINYGTFRSYTSSREVAEEFKEKKHNEYHSENLVTLSVDTRDERLVCYPLYEVIGNMKAENNHLWEQVLERVKKEKEYIVLENDCVSIMK